MRQLLVVVAGLLLMTTEARATDFHLCAKQFRDVEEAASTAAAAADEAADAQDALKQARDDLKQCLDFPDVYDLLEDGCSSQRQDYDMAREDYNSAIDEYNSAVTSFTAELRAIRTSCG